jgi:2-oxoglutarate ferredoxin oxidoreductase subunit alpha
MRKLAGIRATTPGPTLEGPDPAEVTLVGWGSTALPVRDALTLLKGQGIAANYLHVSQPWPLHGEEIAKVLRAAKRTLLVEQNFSGQLGRVITAETGIRFPDTLLKYDGEPFYPWEIVTKVMEVTGHVHR